MVLDMETEFYKLARNILSRPKNLYKMTAIGPKSGRLNIMGADGFVVVSGSLLRSFTTGPENRAYRVGLSCGKEAFGNLIREFDEEIQDLDPSKLMELGLLLTSSLGWGDVEVRSMNARKGKVELFGKRTVELKSRKAKHHMLTCGFLTGIVNLSLRKELQGTVSEIGNTSVNFVFS